MKRIQSLIGETLSQKLFPFDQVLNNLLTFDDPINVTATVVIKCHQCHQEQTDTIRDVFNYGT